MPDRETYCTPLSLNEARRRLEAVAERHGVYLDFLMHGWNGRFATFNLGRPWSEPDGARAGARPYRLIGRLKANTRPDGRVVVVLSPPTSCDPSPTAEDEALFEAFREDLSETLALEEL